MGNLSVDSSSCLVAVQYVSRLEKIACGTCVKLSMLCVHMWPSSRVDYVQYNYTLGTIHLGSFITPLLNKDVDIKMRIKKAKSIMGYSKHFFNNKDVDCHLKYQVYTSRSHNALLWGCETWNLMKKNLNKLWSFHHGVIMCILHISDTKLGRNM